METSGWTAVLDKMELRLAEAERSLAGENVSITPFEIPESAGRLPWYERDRARAVLAATRVMEERIAVEMGTMSPQLHARPQAPGRPAPSFFDQNA
ncbi:MAG TPA: hypothetical protein VG435_15505 [Acidimicrobiales bacterium]|nr:hypothetical protein [Acidimicrobiales bacterium]